MERQRTTIGKTFTPASFPLFLALALLYLAAWPRSASAATRTVSSLNDDGGVNTLRTLIGASVNGDTINFSVAGIITLTNGELAVLRNLTILGPAGGITISGNNASRVFNMNVGTTNSIFGLT